MGQSSFLLAGLGILHGLADDQFPDAPTCVCDVRILEGFEPVRSSNRIDSAGVT